MEQGLGRAAERPDGSLSLEELEHRSNSLIEVGSINLPPLQCSFPWKNHPECAKLKEMCDAWILSRFGDLYPSENDPKVGYTFADGAKLVNSSYHLLTTLVYPSGSIERMPFTMKLMAWFFMFDNLLDDPNAMGGDPEAAEELLASVTAVLRNNTEPPRSSSSRAINVMADTAREWWSGVCEGMSPGQQARFVQAFADYLDGNRHQVRFRESRCLPNLPAYTRLRADTGGWLPCSVLIEYVNGVDLDDETATHPLIRKLQRAAAFHVHCVNDFLSFKKEYVEGDYLNIVMVLYYSKLTTRLYAPERLLQEVVDEVAAMIQEKGEECGRLIKEIRECEALTKKIGLEVYLEGVGNWLGGNLYWHLVSARYGVGAGGPAAAVERPPAADFESRTTRLT